MRTRDRSTGSRTGGGPTDRLDEVPGMGRFLASWRARVYPDHWSLLFGQIAVASFVVCFLTGVFLTFFYEPSVTPVTYDGPYTPLDGVEMSRALKSTLEISFEVQGGLLIRQLHNWSSSLMVAALLLHVLRVFFTGEFRRPRRARWLALFGILFAAMGAGLTGHVLPDDMLSGSSLAVLDGLLKGIPVVGTWLSRLVFAGHYPGGAIEVFHVLHVYVLPATLVALLVMTAVLGARHRPAQYPGPGRTPGNLVGRPFAVAAVKRGGLFVIVTGVLTVIAATVPVNPVWSYGPADPGGASAGGGALWYLAFLDGAQRLVPPGWEFVWLGNTWSMAILAPLAVSGLFLLTAMLYPYIEAWITGDRREHHLLTRPRSTPTRTGIGVAGVVFYGVLWAAAGSDTIALTFSLANETIIHALRVALVLGPVVGFVLARRICVALQRRDRELVLHGHPTGRVVRRDTGEFVEVHRPLDAYERWRLVGAEVQEPPGPGPEDEGWPVPWRDLVRRRLARWFLADRVDPVTPAELPDPTPRGEPVTLTTRR